MVKYDFDFKMMIVNQYLQGQGSYRSLAKKYGVKGSSQVTYWVSAYHKFGEAGLKRQAHSKHYSVQTRLDTIELPHLEVANHFGIKNPSLTAVWHKKYFESGIEGLSKKKGRPPQMAKKKTNQSQKKKLKRKLESTEGERIKELELENHYLEIENVYLKELRRLSLSDSKFLERTKHKSPTPSEIKKEN